MFCRQICFAAAIFIAVVSAADDNGEEWWKTALIYQIYPQSYKDTDGDGIGDLPGITEKLDYLQDLGVDAVWLSPIYSSPWADCGYDIIDYRELDERYGTMDDFDKLHAKAQELGIKLILDLVPGYTSNKNQWFQLSLNRTDPYTNYYVWVDGNCTEDACEPPNNWLSVFRGPAWTWSEEREQFYFHQFSVPQPDLNYRDANVVEEMKNVMRFWLDKGVDGFRVDAVSWLVEDDLLRDEPLIVDPNDPSYDPEDYYTLDHVYTQNQNLTYEIAQGWREVAEEYRNSSVRVLIMETSGTDEQTFRYFGTPEKPAANFPFNFKLIFSVNKSSSASDFLATINSWLDNMEEGRSPDWVLGNHDQHRVGSRLGEELIDAMNILSLLLPGAAVTYMGEEIGMLDNDDISWEQSVDVQGINAGPEKYKNISRDNERTPFQWDDSVSAGFSISNDTWLPVNKNYVTLNVESEKDPSDGVSHYYVYRNLTKLRHADVVKKGDFAITVIEDSDVLVFKRSLNDSLVLVAINFGDTDVELDFHDAFIDVPAELYVYTSSIFTGYNSGGYFSTSSISLVSKAGIVLSTLSPF